MIGAEVEKLRAIFQYSKHSLDPQILKEIVMSLQKIGKTEEDLFWRFCREPSQKLFGGEALSREAFHLLAALGIIRVPSPNGKNEAHQAFDYYRYEDDKRKGFIDLGALPRPSPKNGKEGKARAGYSYMIAPEDVRVSFLREEQREYLKEHEPELFARFTDD